MLKSKIYNCLATEQNFACKCNIYLIYSLCNILCYACLGLFKAMELSSMNIAGCNVTVQGKFVRIHFGTNGKIAGADIESCKLVFTL